jgi:pilus assembly protein CpaF
MAGVALEEDKTIYDVRVGDNSRMIAILAPTSVNGHNVTFRKWMKKQVTWEKLLEFNAISAAARDLVQSALNARVSILIAGGTASGKTTFANRVIELIRSDERVVVVEQAHELQFDHPRSIFLEADGAIATPINDLLTAGSKMRPDW